MTISEDELLKQAASSLEQKIKDRQFQFLNPFFERASKEISNFIQPILLEIRDAIRAIKVEVPKIEVPPIEVPKIEVPPINIPEIKIPKIELPEIKLPEIKVPDISIPEIKLPNINVPEPKVTVNVPEIKIPDIQMPDEMNVRGWVSLMGVDINNPLPVQLRDKEGKPIDLKEGLTPLIMGGGGGFRMVEITDVRSSTDSLINQSDNAIRTIDVTGNTIIVDQLSGANWSVASGSTLDVKQLSGSVWSTVTHFSFVNVTSASATTTVKSSGGTLHSVVINSRGTGSTLKLYDNTTDNGNLIGTIDTTLSTTAFIYDLDFSSGLVAVTAGTGAADLTITYT